MKKGGAVYITTNKNNTTIYTGATEDLVARMIQHKEGHFPNSFTARYNCTKLVYYESHHQIEEALERERLIKAGSRAKKIKLIESINPNWDDLWDEIKEW